MLSPLDHLPQGPGLLTGTQPLYDIEAGRRRIAEKLAARRGQQSPTGYCPCAAAQPGTVPPARPGQNADPVRDRAGLTFHDHAARDLSNLSTIVINENEAPAWLDALVTRRRLDPRGELVFGCLLHLTDRPHEAQFWWQAAAGADNPTAAYCLYLHHARLGELRDADHWFQQAGELESSPARATTATRTPQPPLPQAPLLQYSAWLGQPMPDLALPDQALREAVAEGPAVIDDHYGLIRLPTGEVADQLQELVNAT
ncbi:hypothetical protein ACIGXM_36320 [Kitasatospora sp. NPDC052896]|uniref:hypothetical protein n=1 Tax=Kitasatospora sp. NPDC052896 TaxID=3364061 RepID=UPI0037CBF4DC